MLASLPPNDVVERYKSLADIERGFRVLRVGDRNRPGVPPLAGSYSRPCSHLLYGADPDRVMRERLRARSARPVARAGAVPVGPDPAPPCHTQRNPTRFRNLLDQSGADWHSDGLGRQKTDRERAIDPLVVERFYGAPRQINDLRVYLSNSGDRP